MIQKRIEKLILSYRKYKERPRNTWTWSMDNLEDIIIEKVYMAPLTEIIIRPVSAQFRRPGTNGQSHGYSISSPLMS